MRGSGGDTASGEPGASGHERSFADGDVVARRYRVKLLIGSGGSGEVYEVTDLALGEAVALKTLHPVLAGSANNLERFRREIQLARKVTHPNVCRLFDLGEHDKADGSRALFYTMELLGGQSLSDRLTAKRRMTTAEVLPIATQIALGLQAAHAVGVVHRDLKPGNIMLLPSPDAGSPEKVVLTDFGLARSEGLDKSDLTATDEMIGTPHYMSPEQVRSQPVTHVTDIYSLGVVLYEMLGATLPFVDSTPLAVALKRLRVPPAPLRDHVPDIDANWAACVHRCLEVDPARRFQSAAELMAALRGETSPPGAPAVGLGSFLRRVLGRPPKP